MLSANCWLHSVHTPCNHKMPTQLPWPCNTDSEPFVWDFATRTIRKHIIMGEHNFFQNMKITRKRVFYLTGNAYLLFSLFLENIMQKFIAKDTGIRTHLLYIISIYEYCMQVIYYTIIYGLRIFGGIFTAQTRHYNL